LENPKGSLSELYRNPTDPQPDYTLLDVARSMLKGDGAPKAEIDRRALEVLQSILRNEPSPGQPHVDFSRSLRQSLDRTSDPVALFTGQFTIDSTDVEIGSVGFDLAFTRCYRSGTTFYGPLGFNWDHNYNVHLRELSDGGIALWTGRLREEIYRPAGSSYEPPIGVFRVLERLPVSTVAAAEYVLREAGGTRLVLRRPPGWPHATRIPLTRIEDRHGNGHDLLYDVEGRLSRVIDAAGRFIQFEYDERSLLRRLIDHIGRIWRYEYDGDTQHLSAAISPGTPEHPQGARVGYAYDRWRKHPALIHNLVQLVDAEGAVVVENTYGDNPGSDDFGRIVSQLFGGFESTFQATVLQRVPAIAEMQNVPMMRVEMVDPGTLYVYTFNYRGDLLDARFRLVRDGSYRVVAQSYRYDSQGNLTELSLPDGQTYTYLFDHTNTDPCSRGNLLRATENASPLAPEVSHDVARFTYEPQYQLVKTAVSSTGSVTTFFYDHELPATGTGKLSRILHPPVTLPDGGTRRSEETFAHNAAGQVTSHEAAGAVHTFDYESAGFQRGYLRRRSHAVGEQRVTESFEHNEVGHLTAKTDGVGNRTQFTVNAWGLIDKVLLPDGAEWRYSRSLTGRVTAFEEPRGEYDDAILAGQPLRSTYRYNVLGALVEQTLAANSSTPAVTRYIRGPDGLALTTIDPLGRALKLVADERGNVLSKELLSARGDAVFREEAHYSAGGQLVRSSTRGLPSTYFEYDGFGRRRRVRTPRGAIAEYAYDSRGLLIGMSLYAHAEPPASGAGEMLMRRRWELDERGNVRREFDELLDTSSGTSEDLTTTFWVNDAGLPERIDDPGGLKRRRTYNANGVLIEETDSLGNAVNWELDAAERVSVVQLTEVASSGGVSVSRWQQTYNSRSQLIGEKDPLLNEVTYHYDSRGELTSATNPLGRSVARGIDALGRLQSEHLGGSSVAYTYDAGSRCVSMTDPTGTHLFVHDALDRLERYTRPDGKACTWTYDAKGGLLNAVDFDGSVCTVVTTADGLPETINVSAGPGVSPTDDISFEYDALGRIKVARSGSLVSRLCYDSLGRLVEEETGGDKVSVAHDLTSRIQRILYPDGRRDRINRDELGRVQSITLEAAGSLPLALHGVAAGTEISRIGWAGFDRPESMSVMGKVTAKYRYDIAHRLCELEWRNSSSTLIFSESVARDRLGLKRLERRATPEPSVRSLTYDSLVRLERAFDGLPSTALPLSTSALTQGTLDSLIAAGALAAHSGETEFEYTEQDTPKFRIERDGGGTIISKRSFTSDSRGRVSEVDGSVVTYNDAGCISKVEDREFIHDGLRRLVEVRSGGKTLVKQTYDGLGRVHSRVEATGPAQRFAHLCDEVLQITADAGTQRQYTCGFSLDQPLLESTNSGSHIPVYDSCGSVLALCDVHGDVRERYHYDLFGSAQIFEADGKTKRTASLLEARPSFMGRPLLTEVGLYDFRRRAYDPGLFLFLEPNPILFAESWSPYAFCRFNPLNLSDPYGGVAWNIVAGAASGAALGGVSSWLSGGDAKDIAVSAFAGAVGGGLAATGQVGAGFAVSGAIIGMWGGGRSGLQSGGIKGAVLGGTVGAAVGAGIGVISGGIGSRIGGPVANAASARLSRALTYRAVGSSLANVIRLLGGNITRRSTISSTTAWSVARFGGQVAGGGTGGAVGGAVGNTTATLAADISEDRDWTLSQLWNAASHGFVVGGAFGAAAAPTERLFWIRGFKGTSANRLGAEGEGLVGRAHGIKPANQREQLQVNGRERHPDFFTAETLQEHNAVFEVKNTSAIGSKEARQILDFRDWAQSRGADVLVFGRPGTDLSGLAQMPGVRTAIIPQLPLVLAVPAIERTNK
jgi:RHS repeat-associated protein